MEDIAVIEHIQELMKQKNWTYYKLSKKSGIPCSSLHAMLTNGHIPTVKNLIKICNGFGISVADFFSEIENQDSKIDEITRLIARLPFETRCLIYSNLYGLSGYALSDELASKITYR